MEHHCYNCKRCNGIWREQISQNREAEKIATKTGEKYVRCNKTYSSDNFIHSTTSCTVVSDNIETCNDLAVNLNELNLW